MFIFWNVLPIVLTEIAYNALSAFDRGQGKCKQAFFNCLALIQRNFNAPE